MLGSADATIDPINVVADRTTSGALCEPRPRAHSLRLHRRRFRSLPERYEWPL